MATQQTASTSQASLWSARLAAFARTIEAWTEANTALILFIVLSTAFMARLVAAGTRILNPAEAQHFILIHQTSLRDVYRASLGQAHPPLFYVLLYYWHFLGHSEVMLRLPSVIAGTTVIWVAYKWLQLMFAEAAAMFGLIILAYSRTAISLSTELRHYALMLVFMAASLYFLERALNERSTRMLAAFALALYLAILTHYSAVFFTAALAVYVLLGLRRNRKWMASWFAVALGACAIYAVLYLTHIAKLRGGSMEQMEMNDLLRNAYFQRGRETLAHFIASQTTLTFRYAFVDSPWAAVLVVLFVAGCVLLVIGKFARIPHGRAKAALLLLPFVLAAMAGVARLYPYGGTRHSIYLTLFAVGGMAFCVAALVRENVAVAMVVAILIAIASNRRPIPLVDISPRNQRTPVVRAGVDYIRKSIPTGSVIFTDRRSDQTLCYYLDRDTHYPGEIFKFTCTGCPPLTGEQFDEASCSGYRVIATSTWVFDPDTFTQSVRRMRQKYEMSNRPLWVVQMGTAGNTCYTALTHRFPTAGFQGISIGDFFAAFRVPPDFGAP